jgi:hypothetical protein
MQVFRKGTRKAHVIIFLEAKEGLKGVMECAEPGCGATGLIRCTHPDPDQDACINQHGEEINRFLLDHECGVPRRSRSMVKGHVILFPEARDGLKGAMECGEPGCGAGEFIRCTHEGEDQDCLHEHGEEIAKFRLDHDCIATVPN